MVLRCSFQGTFSHLGDLCQLSGGSPIVTNILAGNGQEGSQGFGAAVSVQHPLKAFLHIWLLIHSLHRCLW